VTFEDRAEKDNANASIGNVTYAIHNLYTAVVDPAALTTKPKPLIYSRHEAPLRDVWQSKPDIQAPKPL
jgi:hypothetical protein